MTYFPEPAWSNIVSFLVDPYKKDREAHAEVWQNIRVKRFCSTMGYVINECEYFVYIRDGPVRDGFGYNDLSGEWGNIEEHIEWNLIKK